MNYDYIVIDSKDQNIKCLHCGAKTLLPLPMDIKKLVKFTDKWSLPHKKCEKK